VCTTALSLASDKCLSHLSHGESYDKARGGLYPAGCQMNTSNRPLLKGKEEGGLPLQCRAPEGLEGFASTGLGVTEPAGGRSRSSVFDFSPCTAAGAPFPFTRRELPLTAPANSLEIHGRKDRILAF